MVSQQHVEECARVYEVVLQSLSQGVNMAPAGARMRSYTFVADVEERIDLQ